MAIDLSNMLNNLVFTNEEIESFVEQDLPKWKEECDAPSKGTLFISQADFGGSVKELLLLALAIKYARKSRKEVTIVFDQSDSRLTSEIR